MARHLLTDKLCREAKPGDKRYFLQDGHGLRLAVLTTGVKAWQLKIDGTTASLGKYPVPVGLSQARKKADKVRVLAAEGVNYAHHKRQARHERQADRANTFGALKRDWVKREARSQKWTQDYRREVEASLDNHLSALDRLPMTKILAPTLGTALGKVEGRAPLMVEKVRRRLNGILNLAVERGTITGNPLPAVRRGRKVERNHYPAVTELSALGEILRKARAADPCKGVARAHVLLVFTALRVSEIVGGTWDEFDLEVGNWSIARARMKRKDMERGPHVVPLPPVLLAALKEWRAADGPRARYVCPAPRDPASPVTPEACEKFYRRQLELAGKHSPHSWRSAFSTVCREAGKDGDTIEAQLDHVVGNKVASAYDRAARLELRRELMKWYEATLLAARDGASVTPIRQKA